MEEATHDCLWIKFYVDLSFKSVVVKMVNFPLALFLRTPLCDETDLQYNYTET